MIFLSARFSNVYGPREILEPEGGGHHPYNLAKRCAHLHLAGLNNESLKLDRRW